jgi:hypothetical protein
MRKAMMAGAAAMLRLAACEDGAPEPQRKVVKPANPTSEGLMKLTELYRFLASEGRSSRRASAARR